MEEALGAGCSEEKALLNLWAVQFHLVKTGCCYQTDLNLVDYVGSQCFEEQCVACSSYRVSVYIHEKWIKLNYEIFKK